VKPQRGALDQIAQGIVRNALDGDGDAIAAIINRFAGKRPQRIDAEVGTTFHIHWSLPPHPLERGLGHERDESTLV
jgi:hypothetical protein